MPLRNRVPEPLRQLRRIVHATSRSYGQLTAPGRVLPSFLICGGHRCGTAGLHRMLAAHPLVLRAGRRDGVSFFDTSYDRGIDWYRGHFPRQRTAQRVARRHGATASAFETSSYYLYHPYAAVRIARDLPDVRLLVIVRDPAARAWSHFRVSRAAGTSGAGGRSYGTPPPPRGAPPGPVAAPTEVYAEVLGFLGLPLLETVPPDPVVPPLGVEPAEPLGARVRRELNDHFVPHDARLAHWLGRPPVWRARPGQGDPRAC